MERPSSILLPLLAGNCTKAIARENQIISYRSPRPQSCRVSRSSGVQRQRCDGSNWNHVGMATEGRGVSSCGCRNAETQCPYRRFPSISPSWGPQVNNHQTSDRARVAVSRTAPNDAQAVSPPRVRVITVSDRRRILPGRSDTCKRDGRADMYHPGVSSTSWPRPTRLCEFQEMIK